MVRAMARSELTAGLYPIRAGMFVRPDRYVVEREDYPESVFLYCAEGRGAVEVGRESHCVETNDVVLMPALERHVYYPESDGAWTMVWVHYLGNQASTYERFFYSRWQGWKATVPSRSETMNLLNAVLTLSEAVPRADGALYAAKVFESLLAKLAFYHQPPVDNRSGLRVEQVEAYMLERLDQSLTLDALARDFGVSKYHFGRWFKAQTGVSPISYFLELKMARASELLAEGQMGVAETAYALNFEDPFYFSRLFKKATGYSPLQYRTLLHSAWGGQKLD